MTNKEIAQALCDRAKAVEVHLSGIYHNPQIKSRTHSPT
jgi:DNA-binding NarL/FixJ family response regulator